MQSVLVLLFLEFFDCFMGMNVQTIKCLLQYDEKLTENKEKTAILRYNPLLVIV